MNKQIQEGSELEEPKHNTDSKECWCNPKLEYIEETDSWVIVHNTLLPDESHKVIN